MYDANDLVEERLVGDQDGRVDRLVEDHVRELGQGVVAAAEHRRQHRVGEPAAGRVRGGRPHDRVVALLLELFFCT